MSLSNIKVEWHVLDDEEWRRRLREGDANERSASLSFADLDQKIRQWILCGGTLIIVAFVALSSAGATTQDLVRLDAESGVRAALLAELQARQQIDRDGLTSLFAPEVNSRWVREWSVLGVSDESDLSLLDLQLTQATLLDDGLWVEVRVALPEPSWRLVSPYREGRFYRPGPAGWQRTTPQATFWGPRYLLQKGPLRFDFMARDAELIERIAPQVEATYFELFRILGKEPDSPEGFTIRIVPDLVNGRGIYLNRLEITSPSLSKIPADLSDEEYLLEQITSGIVYRTVEVREFISFRRDSVYRWRDLQRGLRYWLEDHLTEAEWPWDAQGDELFRHRAGELLPLSVSDIGVWPEGQARDLTYYTWRNAAAKSIVAYTVDAFGIDHIPTLFDGFERYRSRAALVDGVYGLSITEFETGWNTFLVGKYGIER